MAHDKKAESDHPSVDRTGRFPVDAQLRKMGFRIRSRPKQGESLWEKEGILIKYTEAIARIDRNTLADLVYQQDLYYEGFE